MHIIGFTISLASKNLVQIFPDDREYPPTHSPTDIARCSGSGLIAAVCHCILLSAASKRSAQIYIVANINTTATAMTTVADQPKKR